MTDKMLFRLEGRQSYDKEGEWGYDEWDIKGTVIEFNRWLTEEKLKNENFMISEDRYFIFSFEI